MQLYNVEYRYLDSLGRTKTTYHGGIFSDLEDIEIFKNTVLEKEQERSIAFDVYLLDKPLFS